MSKVTVPIIVGKKKRNEKIVTLTAYDAATARIIDETGVDIILVGDSLGNVIQGLDKTLEVTMDEMIYHTKIVSRGINRAHLCGDMPFMSYQSSIEVAIRNAGRFIKDGRAESVKIETNENYLETIYAIQKAGIPVMGHIGLCPQSVLMTGGYKIQGREKNEAKRLVGLANSIEDAGAFSIVLESIPLKLAKKITKSIGIPTIGIGAGPYCDGQVLVINDLVGLTPDPAPKFVKKYANVRQIMTKSVIEFRDEVQCGTFPSLSHSYD
ncbi:3-methyl-2-oxobutanoate hydroxymethyltransferase [Desulfobacterota bacterium AH_259_B03_O07]|nr:3-methyl-2-oxobutanoate hydroxymethyltransferase [Desulfobacterota bacterium AH_259_B03_O07]